MAGAFDVRRDLGDADREVLALVLSKVGRHSITLLAGTLMATMSAGSSHSSKVVHLLVRPPVAAGHHQNGAVVRLRGRKRRVSMRNGDWPAPSCPCSG